MIYVNLFYSFFKIGILGFGGGYAILPLIQSIIVDRNCWITRSEFIDLVTISQITPGPILINSSTFIGAKLAGIPGAVIATIGSVTPSLIIIIIISMLYYKYKDISFVQIMLNILKPAVIGLIAASSMSILASVLFTNSIINFSEFDCLGLLLTATSLFTIRRYKVNPILIILTNGCLYLVIINYIIRV